MRVLRLPTFGPKGFRGLPHQRQEAGMGGPHWLRPAPGHHMGGTKAGAKSRWQGPIISRATGGPPLVMRISRATQARGPTCVVSLLPLGLPKLFSSHRIIVGAQTAPFFDSHLFATLLPTSTELPEFASSPATGRRHRLSVEGWSGDHTSVPGSRSTNLRPVPPTLQTAASLAGCRLACAGFGSWEISGFSSVRAQFLFLFSSFRKLS